MGGSNTDHTTGTCTRHSTAAIVGVGAAVLTAATAYTTYQYARRELRRERAAIDYQQYQRQLLLQEKTAQARLADPQQAAPASGTLLPDVTVERVYLWECQDLRKLYQPANVVNRMQFPPVQVPQIRSPALRSRTTNNETSPILDDTSERSQTRRQSWTQSYNKIITDHECILGDIVRKPNGPSYSVAYMRAGPRKLLHFDTQHVHAAILTAGGLCPGLNNVIREVTNTLHQLYGIGGTVYGIQGGYRGFDSAASSDGAYRPPIKLTPEVVENIHHEGGTCLGSSRGGFDLEKILDFLDDKKINQLYILGGDGTHRGAFKIHEGCMQRGYNVAVAGIPKTIDNDIDYIDHSFGFGSAVEAACSSIRSAKTEAVCNLPNGIGIVKLMGRSAGFIAAHATMASSDVDLCLVPEVPVVLEGENGCLPHLMRRVEEQGFAVVVVAEGAGEELLGTSTEVDASGNKKLPELGEYLKKQINDYFTKKGKIATVKYIDPSYTIRSVAANAADSLYCMQLAQNAVHGAMAGYTGFTVGLCNNRMVWLPIPELVATSPRSMNPHGRTWERVLALTRQPNTVPPLPEGAKKEAYNSHAPMLR